MRKPSVTGRLSGFFVLVCLLGACVSTAPETGEKTAAAGEGLSAVTGRDVSRAPALRAPGDSLASPGFQDLPPEAKDYLRTLAEAFRTKDREFLVSQGEIQYENELRFRVEEKAYLAMLYRAGPYSEEDQWKPAALPLLEYTKIEAIEYTGWEEKGPMLEISGYLHFEGGDPLPCGIMLAWRLLEPKILGARPETPPLP